MVLLWADGEEARDQHPHSGSSAVGRLIWFAITAKRKRLLWEAKNARMPRHGQPTLQKGIRFRAMERGMQGSLPLPQQRRGSDGLNCASVSFLRLGAILRNMAIS